MAFEQQEFLTHRHAGFCSTLWLLQEDRRPVLSRLAQGLAKSPTVKQKRPCTIHLLNASPRESIPSSWQDSYTKSSPLQENLYASNTQQLIASTASKTDILQGHGEDLELLATKMLSHFYSLILPRSA